MFAFLCTQNHNEITEFYDSDACVRYGSKIAYQDPMVILCDDVVDEEFKCLQEDYVLGEQNEIKELIRDEAVHDYFTAGIKAEVILDMLLRPVLEKVLSQLLKGKDQGVHFITKEFPIPTKANDNRNCNVDYLMYDNDYVYLIELKTSSTSEDKKQLENYIEHIYNKGNRGKSFRDLFGERFIWMLNYVSKIDIKSGKIFDGEEWNNLKKQLIKDKDEDCLSQLFDKIISSKDKDIMCDKKTNYHQKAIEYLKKSGKTGSAKYIFQAGQILDSKPEKWWGKPVRLVYIVPKEEVFRNKLEEVLKTIDMTVDLDNEIKVVDIKDIRKQLDDNNDYEKMLRSMLEDIFDFEVKNKNAND